MHKEMCPCGMKKGRMGLGKVVRSGKEIGKAISRYSRQGGTMREMMRDAVEK